MIPTPHKPIRVDKPSTPSFLPQTGVSQAVSHERPVFAPVFGQALRAFQQLAVPPALLSRRFLVGLEILAQSQVRVPPLTARAQPSSAFSAARVSLLGAWRACS